MRLFLDFVRCFVAIEAILRRVPDDKLVFDRSPSCHAKKLKAASEQRMSFSDGLHIRNAVGVLCREPIGAF
jgi:hypothetical protein